MNINPKLFGDQNQFIQQLALMGLENHLLTGPKVDRRLITNSHELQNLIHSHGLQELGLTQIRILKNQSEKVGWCADVHLAEQTVLVKWVQGGQTLNPFTPYLDIFGGNHGK